MNDTETMAGDQLQLPADMRIPAAAELKAALTAFSDTEAALSIDGGDVTRVDASGLQVLAAFLRDRTNAGRAVSWTATSEVLREGARYTGLGPTLGLALGDPEKEA